MMPLLPPVIVAFIHGHTPNTTTASTEVVSGRTTTDDRQSTPRPPDGKARYARTLWLLEYDVCVESVWQRVVGAAELG